MPWASAEHGAVNRATPEARNMARTNDDAAASTLPGSDAATMEKVRAIHAEYPFDRVRHRY